ncbi:MAG: 1-acyl-sn-glycerol-3-phosphate acyltransferase [Magnetospirillum sp. WYHS-4]
MTRVLRRGALFLGLTGLLLPVYLAVLPFGARRRVAALWFSGCCDILGIALRVSGRPSEAAGTLYVANHASYLDILVLGRLLDAAFVAKAEVARWPLFGIIAHLGGTVFVSRRRAAAGKESERMAARLSGGERLVLFPEGTSSDGNRVLPFRSGLFAATEGRRMVQPVSLAYTRHGDGRPLAAEDRPAFSWFGDMELLPHLIGVLGRDGVEVEVLFHPPVAASAFADRKTLAGRCEATVGGGLDDLLAGRRRGAALLPGERPVEPCTSGIYAIG